MNDGKVRRESRGIMLEIFAMLVLGAIMLKFILIALIILYLV